jgi:ribosomal protein L7/L12
MKTLIITGWRLGLDKIALTKVIRAYTGLGLAEGKNCTDQVLENKTVTFTELDIETAKQFLRDIQNVGATGEITG